MSSQCPFRRLSNGLRKRVIRWLALNMSDISGHLHTIRIDGSFPANRIGGQIQGSQIAPGALTECHLAADTIRGGLLQVQEATDRLAEARQTKAVWTISELLRRASIGNLRVGR